MVTVILRQIILQGISFIEDITQRVQKETFLSEKHDINVEFIQKIFSKNVLNFIYKICDLH